MTMRAELEEGDVDMGNVVQYHTKQENPSVETYALLNHAYEYFNKALFRGELPNCLITLQRYKTACGYFSAQQFENKNGVKTDEIALSPEYFGKGNKETMQTLVHEMCHLWQYHKGKPSRNGYHNKEWGSKMKEVGLYPSSTSQEGGDETGQKMGDYAIKGGIFESTFATWEKQYAGFTLFHDILKVKAKGKGTKIKYTCGGCDTKVWGKPGLGIKCEACALVLQSETGQKMGE